MACLSVLLLVKRDMLLQIVWFAGNFCCFPVTQTFDDYSEINEVTTVVRKNLLRNVFHLIFKTALGRLLVADLSIDIFCNCTLGWLINPHPHSWDPGGPQPYWHRYNFCVLDVTTL